MESNNLLHFMDGILEHGEAVYSSSLGTMSVKGDDVIGTQRVYLSVYDDDDRSFLGHGIKSYMQAFGYDLSLREYAMRGMILEGKLYLNLVEVCF
jgi:hypothetical protein